jgi:oxaloacetate decarboxylase gamma subunit
MEVVKTIPEMLGQSGVLSILGMGVVFGFLIIMIVAVTVMGKIIHALGLDKDIAAPAPKTGTGGAVKASAVAAAITAAVTEYQKTETA